MAKNEVQVTIKVKDEATGKMKEIQGTLVGNLKNTQAAANKSTQSIATMMKGLISLQAAKKIVGGLVDAFKEFEKQSGKKVLGDFERGFKQIQVEIAAFLLPYLEKFSDWFKKNEPAIMTTVRVITGGFVALGKIIGATFTSVSSAINLALSGIMIGFYKVAEAANYVLSIMPGISKEAKQGFKQASDIAREEAAVWKQAGVDAALGIKKGFVDAKDAAVDLFKTDYSKGSNIKAKTADEQKNIDAAKKEAEDEEKARLETIKKYKSAAFAQREHLSSLINGLRDKELLDNKKGLDRELTELMISYNDRSAEIDKFTEKARDAAIAQYIDKTLFAKDEMRAVAEATAKASVEIALIESVAAKSSHELEIQKTYDQKNLIQERLDAVKEAEAEQVIAVQDANKQVQDSYQAVTDSIISYSMEWQQIGTSGLNSMANGIKDYYGVLDERINKQAEKDKENVDKTIKGKKAQERAKAKIDEEASKRLKENKRKELGITMIQAVANTALGFTQALAQGGVAGIVTGALVLAAGAIEIAVIAAQMNDLNKYAHGGIIKGSKNTGDNNLIRGNAGEMMINNDQQRRLYDIASGRARPLSGGDIVLNEQITVNGNLDMAAAAQVRSDREKQLYQLRQDLRELNWRGQLQVA